jgi:hypothetical protein
MLMEIDMKENSRMIISKYKEFKYIMKIKIYKKKKIIFNYYLIPNFKFFSFKLYLFY